MGPISILADNEVTEISVVKTYSIVTALAAHTMRVAMVTGLFALVRVSVIFCVRVGL